MYVPLSKQAEMRIMKRRLLAYIDLKCKPHMVYARARAPQTRIRSVNLIARKMYVQTENQYLCELRVEKGY